METFMCLFFERGEESEQRKKDRNLKIDIINILNIYEVEDSWIIANMIMQRVKKYYKENNDGEN